MIQAKIIHEYIKLMRIFANTLKEYHFQAAATLLGKSFLAHLGFETNYEDGINLLLQENKDNSEVKEIMAERTEEDRLGFYTMQMVMNSVMRSEIFDKPFSVKLYSDPKLPKVPYFAVKNLYNKLKIVEQTDLQHRLACEEAIAHLESPEFQKKVKRRPLVTRHNTVPDNLNHHKPLSPKFFKKAVEKLSDKTTSQVLKPQ